MCVASGNGGYDQRGTRIRKYTRPNKGEAWSDITRDIPEVRPFGSAFVLCEGLHLRRNLLYYSGRVHLSLIFRLSLWGALVKRERDDDRKKERRVLL